MEDLDSSARPAVYDEQGRRDETWWRHSHRPGTQKPYQKCIVELNKVQAILGKEVWNV